MNAPTDRPDGPPLTLAALHVYPIKSCGGMALDEAVLDDTGLDLDRAWMLVDEAGEMLTQRECPRLALVTPRFKAGDLVLRAPGMLALHLSLDVVEAPTRVRVWDDEVPAYDMGALAGRWFSDFLGPAPGGVVRRLRLVRFDPEHRRLSNRRWTGEVEAPNAFSDGFPLLVASSASLADLNRRLAERGAAPVAMERFRPNLVIDGLQPWDEDHVHEIALATATGPVRLRLVKPCARCSIPNVDPASGETGTEPGALLATFRADPRVNGGVTFGMNAIVVEGAGATLRTGQAAGGVWSF
jgi:uncharacterized protein YcbX